MSANDPKRTLSCILVFLYNWTTIRPHRSIGGHVGIHCANPGFGTMPNTRDFGDGSTAIVALVYAHLQIVESRRAERDTNANELWRETLRRASELE